MSIRGLLIMLAAAGWLLTTPLAARAEPGYPIEPPDSSVSNGTVRPGEPVIFSGKGFTPGEPILIEIAFNASGAAVHNNAQADRPTASGASSKTVTASPSGTFSTPVELDGSGMATLTATGTISGVVVNQQVTVVAAPPGGSGGGSGPGAKLPVTGQPGQHWLTEIGLALGAIFLGGVLVVAAKRARRPRAGQI